MRLRLEAIRREADAIHTFEFVREDGSDLPAAQAGAHIAISLPNGLIRQYSLLTTGPEPASYRVGIKRDAASRGGSAWLFDHARVGMVFEVAEPINHFPLDEAAPHSVLIAGGIGITPVVAMVERLQALGRSWQLVHAVRRSAECAYTPTLRSRYADRVQLHIDEQAGGPLDLAEVLSGIAIDCAVYCCGPAAMLDRFLSLTAHRPAGRCRIERFSATVDPADTGQFEVQLARSGRCVRVRNGQTIAQALLDAGVDVALACEQGVCGTCETRVLDGIPDHRDMLLSDDEKASNKVMMICCSGSHSPRLVLDL